MEPVSRGESWGLGALVRAGFRGAYVAALVASGAAMVALAPACGDYGPVTLATPVDGGGLTSQADRGVGAACSAGEPCRAGLACESGTCAPGHLLLEGAACVISAECKEGLHCGADRRCRASGRAGATEACASEADCASGNRCNPVGLSAECAAEGKVDVGGACKTGADCFGGLLCKAGACTAPAPSTTTAPLALPAFAGVACEDEAAAPARAHFRVPRGDGDGDFFRLPFPNDVRRKGGKLSLAGFPTPGADVLGFDLVDRYRTWVEANADGFSPYSSVVLRFGGGIDFETLKTKDVIRFVDLTAAADVGFGWTATTASTPYVCGSAITVRPLAGEPLAEGHTFAVLVSGAAKAKGGGAIEVAADFRAVTGATDPGAPLAEAWAAYAPLRTWAKTAGYDLASATTGTVFTTGKPRALVEKTAAAVAAAAPPTFKGWVKCGAAPSPCPGAVGDRACPSGADALFDELHALVTLPVLQKGTPPFRASANDGDVVLDGAGAPASQGSVDVCVSLTVPKTAVMPAGGWPLVVVAHDVDGGFRSHVARGLAKRLASVDAGSANVAVLGFDQVGHGTRKPADVSAVSAALPTWSPGAMRGVSLQATADVLGVLRAARGLTLPAGSSPTSNEIRFGRTVLFGHGQGAAAVALAAPQTSVEGVVLAGNGGSFLDIVPRRTRPTSFFAVAPVVLGEPSLGAASPVLSLLQNAVDGVDPLMHAGLVVRGANATTPRNVFVVYGLGDSFAPAASQVAYVQASGVGVAAPAASVPPEDGLAGTVIPVPAGGNLLAGTLTAIVRQYAPTSGDGHDVVFVAPQAMTDTDRFVADVAKSGVPKIGR